MENNQIKVMSVIGARPNFIKISPFIKAVDAYNNSSPSNYMEIKHTIVHTGQHYDEKMSGNFFKDLGIKTPDVNLGIGSGSHAEQVGKTMIAFEKILHTMKPDWVVLVGDVNATCACSITAKKEQIKVAHIEAGLRSGDMSMPEEINRLVTDRLADLLLTPDRISNENLYREGIATDKVKFVGNIMIDTLENYRAAAKSLNPNEIVNKALIDGQTFSKNLASDPYGVITLHRPSNVDEPSTIIKIVQFLIDEASLKLPLIWPIHPRTRKQLEKLGLFSQLLKENRLIIVEPLGYLQMLCLNMTAKIILTDSGGLQEECCVLGTPCLTLRWNTERPITLKEHGGASVLVGNDIGSIRREFFDTLAQERKPQRPVLWDGHTAERIVECLIEYTVRKKP